jgi:hypothetical protein
LRNFCQRCFTFFVNRTRPPIDSVIFSRSNTLNFRTGQVQLLLDAVLSDDDSSLAPVVTRENHCCNCQGRN